MKKLLKKYGVYGVVAVWAMACFLFFHLAYHYHFFFQEQNQLFLLSGEYIASYLPQTGWASKLIGDFLTQFYYYLLAGPAISRTRAAPGVRPFIIRARAMGMLPVAHRYIGILNSRTNSMLYKVFPWNAVNQASGTAAVMMPAITRPITSHLPMSSIISRKA